MRTFSIFTAAILAVLWTSSEAGLSLHTGDINLNSSLGSRTSFYGTGQESSSRSSAASSSSSSSTSSSTKSSSFGAGFASRNSQSGFVSSGLGSRFDDIDVSAGGLSTGNFRSSSSSSSSEARSASLNKESQASSPVRSTLVGSNIDFDNAKNLQISALQSSTLNGGQASRLSSSSSSSTSSSVNSNSALSDSKLLISGRNLNLNGDLRSSSQALNSDVLDSRRSSIIKNNLGSSEVYGWKSGRDIDVSSVDLSLVNDKQRLGGLKPSTTFSSSSSSSSSSSTWVDGKKVKPTTVKSSNYDIGKSGVRVSSSSRNADGLQNIELNNIVDGLKVKSSSSLKNDALNSRLIKTSSLNSNANSAAGQQVIRNSIEGNMINVGNKWASGGASSLDLTNKIAKVDGISKGLAQKKKVVGFTTLNNKLAMKGVNINNVGVTKLPLVSNFVGSASLGKNNLVGNIVPSVTNIGITNRRNLLGKGVGSKLSVAHVGGMLPSVAVVGGIVPSVARVSGIVPSVASVGGIVPSVARVSGIVPSVASVGGIVPSVARVSGIVPSVASVGGIVPSVARVSGIVPSVASVGGIVPSVARVSGIVPSVARVSGIVPSVASVSGIVPSVARVSGIVPSVASVSGIVPSVASVSGIVPSVASVSGIVPSVAGVSVATQGAATLTNSIVGNTLSSMAPVVGGHLRNLQSGVGSGLQVGTVVGQNSQSSSGSYSNSQSSQSSGSGSKSASEYSSSTKSSNCGCGSSSSAERSLSSSSDSSWSSGVKSSSSDAGSWSSNSGVTSWKVVV